MTWVPSSQHTDLTCPTLNEVNVKTLVCEQQEILEHRISQRNMTVSAPEDSVW
jgi:hypothetical protein